MGVALKNNVILSGGIVTGNVYGGDGNLWGTAEENTVIVTGTVNVSSANISGSKSDASGKNNHLIIDGWSDSIKNIRNFKTITFRNTKVGNDDVVVQSGTADLKDTEFNIESFAGGQQLASGEQIHLISNASGWESGEQKVTEVAAGVGQLVDGTISSENGMPVLSIDSVRVNPQTALLAKGRAASAAFLNQGSDLLADGLDVLSRDHQTGLRTFAAVYGGRYRYDGSLDQKINGWSTIAGLGGENHFGDGRFLWSLFYENGTGNYRTWNESQGQWFRGDGSILYNGGGAVARAVWDNRFYAEGSIRAGTLKNSMNDALRDSTGQTYSFSTDGTYYGLHFGAGRVMNIGEDRQLDMYGKFFHTYTEGETFYAAGDRFDLAGIRSDRLRFGARVTENMDNVVSAYYGLAWEYEFDGDVAMTVQGRQAPEQSLGGSSVMVEAGIHWIPGGYSSWRIDAGVRGYAGEQEGVSGSIQLTRVF